MFKMTKRDSHSRKANVALGIIFLVLIGLTSGTVFAGPIFTGNAPADFTAPDVYVLNDPTTPDVGIPPSFPAGTISGWDVRRVYLDYDFGADILYVGVDCFGICGDADGDGDPGLTRPELESDGGEDVVDLGGQETFSLFIDTNNSAPFDVVIGKAPGASLANFRAYTCLLPTCNAGDPNPATAYGTLLAHPVSVFASPSVSGPDLEFSISGFSTLPNTPPIPPNPGTLPLRVRLFSGSFEDAGVGEDRVFGSVPLAVTLNALSASAAPDHVRLAWETTSEVGNLGFNLYRAPSALLPEAPLNATLIPSQAPGSGQGASYEYLDASAAAGTTYYYWLEDVDADGTRTLHDPVMVTTQTPTAVTVGAVGASAATGGALPWLAGALGLALAVGRRLRQRR